MNSDANLTSSAKILAAATKIAQARGYGGLNVRELAQEVGMKAASLYYHFPSKADLAAAVARCYWNDAVTALEALRSHTPNPLVCLRKYPEMFRRSLENDNRMCLASFMAAEHDDLPESVKNEIQTFVDVNVAWLEQVLLATGVVSRAKEARQRALAIYAAIAGAQLLARGQSDIKIFDMLIASYRATGLIPA